MKKWVVSFGVALFGIGIAFVGLEIAARVYLSVAGTEEQRGKYIYSWEQINERAILRGEAYLNYAFRPGVRIINEQGYPEDPIAQPKPEGVYRIVALGGSSTYGANLQLRDLDWPTQLETVLRMEYGFDEVEVINAGVPAYTTWESLVNLQFRVLDLEPDLIIVYHGVNDLSARSIYPAEYDGLPANVGYWVEEPFQLPISALYRYLAIKIGVLDNPLSLGLHFKNPNPDFNCCANLTPEQVADHFEANPPIYFERNIRNMVAIANMHDIDVLLSTWAYYPLETDPGMNSMVHEYRQNAIAEQNSVLATIANDTDAMFIDIQDEFPLDRDLWQVDGIHQEADAARIQASAYARLIAGANIMPETTSDGS